MKTSELKQKLASNTIDRTEGSEDFNTLFRLQDKFSDLSKIIISTWQDEYYLRDDDLSKTIQERFDAFVPKHNMLLVVILGMEVLPANQPIRKQEGLEEWTEDTEI